MPITFPLTRACTILHRVPDGTDDDGNEKYRDEPVDAVCSLQQEDREEPGGSGEFSDTRWLIVLNPDQVVDTAAAVVVDGDTFEVVGEPWAVWNPWEQRFNHVELTARRTAGAGDIGS